MLKSEKEQVIIVTGWKLKDAIEFVTVEDGHTHLNIRLDLTNLKNQSISLK